MSIHQLILNIGCFIFGHRYEHHIINSTITIVPYKYKLPVTVAKGITYCPKCKSIIERHSEFNEIVTITPIKEYYNNLKSEYESTLLFWDTHRNSTDTVLDILNEIKYKREFCEAVM